MRHGGRAVSYRVVIVRACVVRWGAFRGRVPPPGVVLRPGAALDVARRLRSNGRADRFRTCCGRPAAVPRGAWEPGRVDTLHALVLMPVGVEAFVRAWRRSGSVGEVVRRAGGLMSRRWVLGAARYLRRRGLDLKPLT